MATRVVAVVGLALVAGCGGAPPSPVPHPGPDPFAGEPRAVFDRLEQRLVDADRVELTAVVSASGAVTAELTGTIVVEPQLEASIVIDGTFDGNELEARWASSAAKAIDTPPPTWADGILVGWTRMGVLHNWARMVVGGDPDVDVRAAMEVTELAWQHGVPASRTLTGKLVFSGAPIGEVELTLDERGLPRHRVQVVHFPEGDMRVLEEYAAVSVK